MNTSIFSLHSNYITLLTPFLIIRPHISSFGLRHSSFTHSISPILSLRGSISSEITGNSFSFCLSTPVIVENSANFTTITSKQTPSSSCTFSFDIFYQITSSAIGGGMLVSGSSLSVSLHSCQFIQCYCSYYGCSAGGLSVYSAYNFTMECCLFNNCSSTTSDTNSFQINSADNSTQYCSIQRVCNINGGLMYTTATESLVGGSAGLSYSNHNVTLAHSTSSCGFTYIELIPSNSVIGRFSICANCKAAFDLRPFYLSTAATLEYMNVINTTGNSYIVYSTDSVVELSLSKCVFVYSQSVSLTSFTASSSQWAAFINCDFSFTPTAAQISGNSVSGSIKYDASAGDANTGSKSADLSCFMWPASNKFTNCQTFGFGNNPAIIGLMFSTIFAA